jgi:hypothetical protein
MPFGGVVGVEVDGTVVSVGRKGVAVSVDTGEFCSTSGLGIKAMLCVAASPIPFDPGAEVDLEEGDPLPVAEGDNPMEKGPQARTRVRTILKLKTKWYRRFIQSLPCILGSFVPRLTQELPKWSYLSDENLE